MSLLEYFSKFDSSFSISSSSFLPYALTKTTTKAIIIKIPSGITIPKIKPIFVDEDYCVVVFTGARTASADPLIAIPPINAPDDKDYEIPLATEVAPDAEPTESTVAALTDPSVKSLKKQFFFVNFLSDDVSFLLT